MRNRTQPLETFSATGAAVAKVTATMKKPLPFLLLVLGAAASSASAQQWSVGVGSGAFVFGDFVRRSLRAGTEQPGGSVSELKLTARTRPGLAADIERTFGSGRLGLRLAGSFTETKLAVRDEGGSTIGVDAGRLDITTLMLPLVVRINPHGTFRFHLSGGPAYAMYHVRRRATGPTGISVFEGTRNRVGAMAGAGIDWWLGDRFALEGEILDIETSSPFQRSDFAGSAFVQIPRTRNVHTTVGVRWKLR